MHFLWKKNIKAEQFIIALPTWWPASFLLLPVFRLFVPPWKSYCFVKGPTLKWAAWMNSLAVFCASYSFSVVYNVLCYSSLLQSHCLAPVDSVPALLAVTVVVVVAHPLMSKLLICTLPWLSAVCCLGCFVFVMFLVHMTCLSSCSTCCRHWLATAFMHLKTLLIPLIPSPLKKSWLAVAMTTPCCPALLLPALPSCSACGTLPCPCPVPFGDCPPMRCLWLTVLWGMV